MFHGAVSKRTFVAGFLHKSSDVSKEVSMANFLILLNDVRIC